MTSDKSKDRSIRTQLATFATERLKEASSGADVAATVVQSWALAEQLLDDQLYEPLPKPIACHAGCSHCCTYSRIETTPVEMITLAWWLRGNLKAERLDDLRNRIAIMDKITNGLSLADRSFAGLDCALLENGQCSVYTMRPLDCKGFESMSEDICRSALPQGKYSQIPLNQPRKEAMKSARKGLQKASRACGFDAVNVELTAGLHIALKTPDIAERWLAGESLFADACYVGWRGSFGDK